MSVLSAIVSDAVVKFSHDTYLDARELDSMPRRLGLPWGRGEG